jgi:hypothetical protein
MCHEILARHPNADVRQLERRREWRVPPPLAAPPTPKRDFSVIVIEDASGADVLSFTPIHNGHVGQGRPVERVSVQAMLTSARVRCVAINVAVTSRPDAHRKERRCLATRGVRRRRPSARRSRHRHDQFSRGDDRAVGGNYLAYFLRLLTPRRSVGGAHARLARKPLHGLAATPDTPLAVVA